jgi:hypothetical protein
MYHNQIYLKLMLSWLIPGLLWAAR